MTRRLIINADDLGYDPEVTRGILRAMREGVVSSATLMVNTPFSRDAATEAKGLAIGLHLNLARNRPISNAVPDNLLEGGELVEARADQLSANAVEGEVHAQLDLLEKLTGQLATHVDVHKHLHRHPSVLQGLERAALKRQLPVRAINDEMRRTLRDEGLRTSDHFVGDAGESAYWTLEQLGRDLAALGEGTTELMCHPGYTPSKVRSGYSSQRETELATFVHREARALLQRQEIQLIDFRAL